ncbi:alpha/beta hydrolase [Henriciella aquimarina]|uniref:alpha/beta hydrolase n=1 Tax=Henriciella aquimarina TaxID=545261 RepID=UPI001F32F671|nr:alpha/beta hydrolase [Henriciella aquimarina]
MRRYLTDTAEGSMQAIEFGNPALEMAALWLHATGFNSMTYQSILAPFGLRTKVTALDLRGHGRTKLPADPKTLHSWHRYRDDVITFLEKNATRPVVLSGHSMGGCVALLVAGKRPDLVKGLVLVDPVIMSRRFYFIKHAFPFLGPFLRVSNSMARQAKKRRAEFPSVEAAREAYTGKGAFKTWREPFLDDYLIDGLERVDDRHDETKQRWRLLCEPAWEAATFNAQRNQPWGALRKVRKKNIPIMIMRPEINPVMSDKVTDLILRKYPDLVLKERPNTTHFHPMEAPYEIREELSTAISRLIEGFSAGDEGPMRRSLRGTG